MKKLGIFLSAAAFVLALSVSAYAGEGKDKTKCETKSECCKKDKSDSKSAETKKEQPAK
ncbi:MAG: hypothetical protein WHT29_00105 [Bacteroidales bacterium]|nr:hypothetical protein [Bacteroidales bacterium]HOK98591.1 hypothetical protein [Bacteroidales bacterium]HPO66342.1 hypothetical protein [Bacteroidales bacterium]